MTPNELDRLAGLEEHYNIIASNFENLEEGDFEYKMACLKPLARYPKLHEPLDIEPPRFRGVKKLGKVKRARLNAKLNAERRKKNLEISLNKC